VENLTFFPDNKHLAFFNEDRIIEVWDIISQQKKFLLLEGEQRDVTGGTYNNHLKLSPNGRWLAGDSVSGKAMNIWDTHSQKLLLSLPEQNSTIHGSAWSPGSNLLAVGRSDGAIAIWNLESIRSQLSNLGLDW
jgi:WD40 repeat protein